MSIDLKLVLFFVLDQMTYSVELVVISTNQSEQYRALLLQLTPCTHEPPPL